MKRIFLFITATILCSTGAIRAQSVNPHVAIETSMGNITIQLYPNAAPVTVDNFLGYVDSGFYDGLIFHRVIEDFMIQAGGYDQDLVKKEPNDPIINESDNGLLNLRATAAMARTADPNSATSQFYINTVNNNELDYVDADNPGYCVFGRVMSGMDVVDAIEQVETSTQSGFQNVPVTPVFINSATRLSLDLAIDPPAAAEFKAIPNSTVDYQIRIQNAGINTAASSEPNQPFIVSLYLTKANDDDITDPCSQKLGQYSVMSLAGLTMYTENITFTAPLEISTYYLKSVVDDGNKIAEFVETNNIHTQTFIVEPNQPDLLIAAPSQKSISTEPATEVTVNVDLLNDGGNEAVNSFDPNGLFYVSLYQSEDPCLSGAAVVADFSLAQLDEHSHQQQQLTFTAPASPGTYYLYAYADDGNNVIESDELNNQGQTITLEVEWEPSDVQITTMYVLPGVNVGSDTFMIFGNFADYLPSTSQIDTTNSIDIEVGPYQESISRANITKLGDAMYLYRGSSGHITLMLLNLTQGSFIIMAQGADLTGIASPIDFELAFSDYRGIDQVNESVINGPSPLSLRFTQGVADKLAVTYYTLITNRPYLTTADSLTILGQISTAIENPNIARKKITIKWGSSTFDIPAGSNGLRQIGNSKIFIYNRGWGTGEIAYAYFNFQDNTFRISLNQASSLPLPTADFGLSFDLGNEVAFDQTIEVD